MYKNGHHESKGNPMIEEEVCTVWDRLGFVSVCLSPLSHAQLKPVLLSRFRPGFATSRSHEQEARATQRTMTLSFRLKHGYHGLAKCGFVVQLILGVAKTETTSNRC